MFLPGLSCTYAIKTDFALENGTCYSSVSFSQGATDARIYLSLHPN